MAYDKDILAAIDEADPTLTRSRLAHWMRQNHDALDNRLRGHRTVWPKLVSVFVAKGLTDARGNPPNPETARKTWQRVKREVKRAREDNPPATRTAASTHAPPVKAPSAKTEDEALRMIETAAPTRTSKRSFAISSPKKEI